MPDLQARFFDAPRAVRQRSDAREPVPAVTTTVQPAAPADASQLESLAPSKARLPIATTAGNRPSAYGRIRCQARGSSRWRGCPGLRNDAVSLTHCVCTDREIVVDSRGVMARSLLRVQQLFWLELRPGQPPTVRRQRMWVGPGTGAGRAVASASGVQVDLGVWNGERRSATLTAASAVTVARRREPRRPLSRADCATVIKDAESCATSRDCSSFKSSARSIPLPLGASHAPVP
jgi:hypothetical protein